MHERFKRKIWVFRSDFTGALAKCLVKQSPYIVPEKLSVCITKFHEQVDTLTSFNNLEIGLIDLSDLTKRIEKILWSIPEIAALNEAKNGGNGGVILNRFSKDPEPDDAFVDIAAVARNITCDFANRTDAHCWLSRYKRPQKLSDKLKELYKKVIERIFPSKYRV